MINSVNLNNVNNKFYSKPISNQKQDEETEKRNVGLSGYKASQAILNRNNITFRNLATPIEVTDKYNKTIEGKDHLDLPNVHVYEYPDTNLQVFVNIDRTILTNDEEFFEQPQVLVKILNNSLDNRNIENMLLRQIIKTKLEECSQFVLSNQCLDEQTFCSYTEWGGKSVVDNIKNLNQVIFNLKINDKDVGLAKSELINKYGKDAVGNISTDYLQNYYNGLRENFAAQAFVTISENYHNKSGEKLFSELNKNINIKLKKIDNKLLKKHLLNEFTLGIMNSYKEFNKEFEVILNEDKEISDYKIISKNKFDQRLFSRIINKMLQENMSDVIKEGKVVYETEILNGVMKNDIPFIKNIALTNYGGNYLQAKNIIKSFSENNIKENISKNFVQQKVFLERGNDENC